MLKNVALWRYMSLSKLFDLIGTSELHFSTVEAFADRWERLPPDFLYSEIFWSEFFGIDWQINKSLIHKYGVTRLELGYLDTTRLGISCWTQNCDSAALWELYSSRADGVAVVTSLDRVVAGLHFSNCDWCVVDVEYLDDQKLEPRQTPRIHYCSTEALEPSTARTLPYIYKRAAFRDEMETRIIVDTGGQNTFLRVPVNLPDFIEAIVVAPEASQGLEEFIRTAISTKCANVTVRRSNLTLSRSISQRARAIKARGLSTLELRCDDPPVYCIFGDLDEFEDWQISISLSNLRVFERGVFGTISRSANATLFWSDAIRHPLGPQVCSIASEALADGRRLYTRDEIVGLGWVQLQPGYMPPDML